MFGLPTYNYDEFRRTGLLKDMAKARSDAPKAGERAPDFELQTLDGKKIRLSDFEDEKNVVLTFGSATCPLTAGSIGALQNLYEEFHDNDVEFLFVYTREAHPGEQMRSHHNIEDKIRAAELLRDEEEITFPILIDELNGKVHRKYGALPNPSFIIDRSGRISFRSLSTRPDALRDAIQELLARQQERDIDHVVVGGGEAKGWPPMRSFLHSYRALERGGDQSIRDFRREMGVPGRIALMSSRMASPVVEHPKTTLASVGAIAGVIGLGFWIGAMLRHRRFENASANRYESTAARFRRTGTHDYDPVGS